MSAVSDQYTVSGLTNCLVDVRHHNKTLKCFKTFNNVIQRLVYKGIYGLQCSQSVIPACFEMNESSASWKTNTQGKATSLMLFSIFVHDPGLMTLDLYNIIARASNAWTVSGLPHNQSDNVSSLQLESQKISFEGKKNQYVASVCWMQRLELILQWQLYTGGGRDSSEVIVSQFSKDVAACLGFGSGVYFVNRIFYFFSWRWLVTHPVAFYIFKWLIFFHAVPKPNVLIRCRNTSMQDTRFWLELVRAAFTHSLLKCFVILNYTKQALLLSKQH